MAIPYVDLAAQHSPLKADLLAAVERVLDHGRFILGPEVAEFERCVAERLGVGATVGVASGTDALTLALREVGVGAGDEVLTVSHTFAATATAIRAVGAVPVFVDVDDETMLLDPEALAVGLTGRTRAVLPVHLGGFACDMTRISAFCEENGLALVEDCAQSIGARHRDRSVGSFGVGAFSLHPLKILSAAGDGGFVSLAADSEALRRRRNLGLARRGWVTELAPNSRLDTLQAAILLVKLRHLDAWIEARRAHAAAYREALAGLLRLPPEEGEDFAVYSTFVVRHPRRDALARALRRRGVDCLVHYPFGVHEMPAFADAPRGELAVTERVVGEILSLPVTPELSVQDRGLVIDAVGDACRELGGG